MKKPKYTKDWKSTDRNAKEKKSKTGIIWTSIIAFLMVSSIMGYMWMGDDEPEFTYKEKYEFTRRNNVFIYDNEGQEFSFRFFPSEIEELKNETDTSGLKKPIIGITFDPDTELTSLDLVRFELSNELPKLNIYLAQGVTKEDSIYSLPVFDCQNATSSSPVIRFEKDEETKIVKEGNCYIFKAKNDYDTAKLKDTLMYILLGIY